MNKKKLKPPPLEYLREVWELIKGMSNELSPTFAPRRTAPEEKYKNWFVEMSKVPPVPLRPVLKLRGEDCVVFISGRVECDEPLLVFIPLGGGLVEGDPYRIVPIPLEVRVN